MTEQLAPNQKKIVDWDKKSDSDAERISKRLEGRSELDDRTSTANDVSARPVAERTPCLPCLSGTGSLAELYYITTFFPFCQPLFSNFCKLFYGYY